MSNLQKKLSSDCAFYVTKHSILILRINRFSKFWAFYLEAFFPLVLFLFLDYVSSSFSVGLLQPFPFMLLSSNAW